MLPRNATSIIVALWVLNVIMFEVLVFRFQEISALQDHRNIFIVSDPQLTDNYSYSFVKSNPFGLFSTLLYFFSDLYMKKNFASILARNNIHGIVLQGDLMDSGRYQDEPTYAWEFERFKWVFRQYN